jgi:hypothetical protein
LLPLQAILTKYDIVMFCVQSVLARIVLNGERVATPYPNKRPFCRMV